MKMICPHCGVKGSADSSLLSSKVRCPKCSNIFQVLPEFLQPIPVEAVELEQVDDHFEPDPGMTDEDEVDDVLSRLLSGDDEVSTDSPRNTAAFDDHDLPGDGDIVAALSGPEDEFVTAEKAPEAEDEDETLIIIEDIEDEFAAHFSGHANGAEELITLAAEDWKEQAEEESGENDFEAASEGFNWDDLDQHFPEDQTGREVSSFSEAKRDQEHFDDPEYKNENADEENPGAEEDHDFLDEDHQEQDGDRDNAASAELEEDKGLHGTESESTVRKCSACDEYVDPDFNYNYDGNVYCEKCIPTELKEEEDTAAAADGAAGEVEAKPGRFTISTLIKDAWHYSKGVKGAIWVGILVMYLLLVGMGAAAVVLLPEITPQDGSIRTLLLDSVLQIALSFLYFLFTAGIIVMAVHKIGRKQYSWKMIFSGFSRFGSLLILFILQSIMLVIGFLLFILPGIYLSVGYILAIPLLFEKNLSPWQALEVSRQAVHKRWWTVFFSLIAMSIIITISTIPLGLGLIWTIPMFIVLIGVLYYHFFGAEEE